MLQKSTGPRTPDGKAAVRQNAFRHGLSAAYPLLTDEHDGAFERIHTSLIEDNQPVGVNEEILVYKMAENFFFQRRATWLLTDEIIALQQGDPARPLALMLRYHGIADRGFNRSLHDLRKLQKERKLEEIGFVSQNTVETPVETPAEPQPPAAEPPKIEPVVATQPVRTPFPVVPTAARPLETQKGMERELAGQSAKTGLAVHEISRILLLGSLLRLPGSSGDR
jgi:hypothetical protein